MKPSLERLPDIQWPPIRDQTGRIIKFGRIFGHGQQLSGKHERFQPDLPSAGTSRQFHRFQTRKMRKRNTAILKRSELIKRRKRKRAAK